MDEIIIEGDLANHVIRIKATGKVAWEVGFGAVCVAVVVVLAAVPAGVAAGPFALVSEGTIATTAAISATTAVTVWGLNTTVVAVGIGVGARSAIALKHLRNNYKIKSVTDNKLVLIKK